MTEPRPPIHPRDGDWPEDGPDFSFDLPPADPASCIAAMVCGLPEVRKHIRDENELCDLHGAVQTAIAREITCLRAELDAANERAEKADAAINWACGCGEGEFQPPPRAGAYWWRAELVERAGMKYDTISGCYVRAALEPRKEGGE